MPDASPEKLRTVGALVIQRRLAKGFKTKIQLADKTGLSTRVLSDLESGKRRLGTVSYVQIETALGWPAGEIDAYLDGIGSFIDDEELPGSESVRPSTDDEPEFEFLTRVREDLTDEEMDQLMKEATPYLEMLVRDIKNRNRD